MPPGNAWLNPQVRSCGSNEKPQLWSSLSGSGRSDPHAASLKPSWLNPQVTGSRSNLQCTSSRTWKTWMEPKQRCLHTASESKPVAIPEPKLQSKRKASLSTASRPLKNPRPHYWLNPHSTAAPVHSPLPEVSDVAVLDLGMVLLAAGAQGKDRQQCDSYAEHGKDPDRIRKAVQYCTQFKKHSCGHHKEFECKAHLIQQTKLQEFCNAFHSLDRETKVALLSSAYGVSNKAVHSPQSTPVVWKLLGEHTCTICRNKLMGVQNRQLFRLARGVPDMRQTNGKAPSSSIYAHQFFLDQYHSAAEVLPEGNHTTDVDASFSHCTANGPSWKQPCVRELPQPAEATWDLGASFCQDIMKIAVQGGKLELAERHLHHQRLSDLWWQFQAWLQYLAGASAQSPVHSPQSPGHSPQSPSLSCSWTCFWGVWHEHWRHVLKFRKSSQHSQCKQCMQFSSYIHFAKGTAAQKQEKATEWLAHMRGQYHDRCVYWHLRWSSRSRLGKVLCIIIDAMDKAKCAYPQFPLGKSKELDGYSRPKMVVTGAAADTWRVLVGLDNNK